MKEMYESNTLSEPTRDYRIHQENIPEPSSDIPEEHLLQQITKADRDIQEGKLLPHEENFKIK